MPRNERSLADEAVVASAGYRASRLAAGGGLGFSAERNLKPTRCSLQVGCGQHCGEPSQPLGR
jgi:hypothetical protein